MEKLFKLFNKQLQRHGIMTIKEGAIVDASIVDSPNKPSGGRQIVIAATERIRAPMKKKRLKRPTSSRWSRPSQG